MTHALQIIPIPAFEDNYIWLLHQGAEAIVVDPGDATPVIETLKKLHLSLNTILITHHHGDHIDGVAQLITAFPDCCVYAPKLEHYDFPHRAIGGNNCENNQTNKIEIDLKCAQKSQPQRYIFHVIDVPGHTLGHIAYLLESPQLESPQEDWLFCGDTLFGAGCGRLFEGSPEQMLGSLKKLVQLNPATKVFCTHEYTLKNIQFALSLTPQNPALIARKLETEQLRHQARPTLPSTIALERATNPFLRCHTEPIQWALNMAGASELAIFTQMRKLRNHY